MERRHFVKLCTAAAAALVVSPEALVQAGTAKTYPRAKLVDKAGQPMTADALQKDENYIFHYPYVGTPCFLIRLGKPVKAHVTLKTSAGETYVWKGGVGPDHAVVAFSAICSHQLVHPSPNMSLISYSPKPGQIADKPRMITCCAHASVFDPSEGAKVVVGPAPQPLAAVLLEEDGGALYATGIQGGALFHEFLRAFKRELRKQFGRGAAKHQVEGTTTVTTLEDYSKSIINC